MTDEIKFNNRFRFEIFMEGPNSLNNLQSLIQYAKNLIDDEHHICSMITSLHSDPIKPTPPPPKEPEDKKPPAPSKK
jgi:hypothetical protein